MPTQSDPAAPIVTAARPWPSAWVRAALEPAILGALTAGPLHGYGITQTLAARGFGTLRGGSLYPVLARLEEAGHVSTRWVEGQGGPGRKDYALTDAGRTAYADAVASFRALGAALAGLGAGVDAGAEAAAETLTASVPQEGTR